MSNLKRTRGPTKKTDWPLTAAELERIANEERQRFRQHGIGRSMLPFRELYQGLYSIWDEYNRQYFDGQLRVPHITFGVTPPRALGFYKEMTDWGSRSQITLRRALVWGTSRVIINPWPALGTKRYIGDILLHESVHQYQHEIIGKAEASYGGHGAGFAGMCNKIGEKIGLPRVIPKRRKQEDVDRPRCTYWPMNVRPDGYYCEDVALEQSPSIFMKPEHTPDVLALWKFVVDMLETGQTRKLLAVARREIELLLGECSFAAAVRRPFDDDGIP